ncbi:MAG: hypothetical protein ACXWIU_12330 [Limisphaerales bacterium]
MRTAFIITNLVLTLVMAVTCAPAQSEPHPAAPAQTPDAPEVPTHIPVGKWLSEPEQHLPGWTIHVDPPVLTFPLRLAVTVRGEATVSKTKLTGHDLHFFVKVSDATGNWFPDRRYSSIHNLPKSGIVTVTERFFAKPGDYQITLLIYDSKNDTHGVWHRSVHVAAEDSLLNYPSAPEVQFIDPDEPFKGGAAPTLPPLENHKPLLVDIVLNLTERSELELRERPRSYLGDPMIHGGGTHFAPQTITPDWQLGRPRQNFTTETLLSIANTMNQLKVNGCVRVSVVDAVRSKVLLDRRSIADPGTLLASMNERRNTQKVDAHVLVMRQQAGTFLHNFLQSMIADTSACNESVKPVERAIVLISDALVFPESSQLTPLTPPTVVTPATHFYFFRMTVHEYIHQIGMGRAYVALAMSPDDQVGRLLVNLDVRRFDLSQPKDLQKALPKFMEALAQ